MLLAILRYTSTKHVFDESYSALIVKSQNSSITSGVSMVLPVIQGREKEKTRDTLKSSDFVKMTKLCVRGGSNLSSCSIDGRSVK